jgi:hypothetical protein
MYFRLATTGARHDRVVGARLRSDKDSMYFRLAIAGAALALGCGGAAAQAAKKPASVLTITNNRAVPAVEVAVGAGEAVVKLPRELGPKARATLKLPKMTGCTVAVAATFADESVVEVDDFDVCQERNVRFTD